MLDGWFRTGRTILHLSPVQVAHRLRLRLRSAFGARNGTAGREREPPRAWRGGGAGSSAVPRALTHPSPPGVTARRAEEVDAGIFDFLAVRRDLGPRPFPPPTDVSLLWAYQLEYMDYLADLARAGRWEAVARLVANRLECEERGAASRHPYPDSRRAATWFRLIDDAPGPLAAELRRGAVRWAMRVRANLEYDVNGNHLLENGLALVLAGGALPGAEGARFAAEGGRILRGGVREQILEDGGHYERSPMYHARVLRVLAEGGARLDADGRGVPEWYWQGVAEMGAWLRAIREPDGSLPLLGDSVEEEDVDPGLLLAGVEAACPFPIPATAPGDRMWTGTGLVRFEDPREQHRLLLDAGPVCPERLPAHGQADTFSFVLTVGGLPFVVDAGVFEYAPGEMRAWSRATRAHSTLTVDGTDSSEVYSSFRIGRRARVHGATFGRRAGLGEFSGEHDGYRHLGFRHARAVSHLAPGVWLVRDRVRGSSPRIVTSRLHLHPEAVTERVAPGRYRVHRRGRALDVLPFGPARVQWEDGWHCPAFGVRRASRLLCLEMEGRCGVLGWLLVADAPEEARVRPMNGGVEAEVGGRTWWREAP